jgi:hypothetical protein
VQLTGALKDAVDAFDQQSISKDLAEMDKATQKLGDSLAKNLREESQKTAAALNRDLVADLTAFQTYATKVRELTLSGTDLQLDQLDVEQKAEIAHLGTRTEVNAAWYDKAKAEINAYYAYKLNALYVDTAALKANTTEALQAIASKAWATYQAMAADTDDFSEDTIRKFKRIAEQAQDAASGIHHSFANAFQNIGSSILSAFQGGGNVMKTIGGTVGGDLASGILGKPGEGGLLDTLGDKLGKSVGGILGSALPGIGTLLGGLAGNVLSSILNIGGPSKDELQSRADRDAFMKQFQTFSDTTGIQSLANALTGAGVSADEARRHIAAMLDANTPKAFEAALEPITETLDLQAKALADLPVEVGKVTGGFSAIATGLFAPAQQAFDAFKKSLSPGAFKGDPEGLSAAFQQGFTIPTQEAFDRTARLATTAFNAALAGGQGFLQAIKAIGPGLDSLTGGLNTFGGMTASPQFWGIAHLRDFLNTNKALADQIQGVNDMMSGLHNMGMLTQQDFTDLNATAVDTFNQMKAGGVDGALALKAMQPTLQKIWELHHDVGLAVDDATQALIDQAQQQGLVGEQAKDINHQMLDVLTSIRDVLADATGQTDRFAHALNALPKDKTITIHQNVETSGGGDAPPDDVPTYGPEVFVPSPRMAIVGTHGGEVVLHKSTYDALAGHGGGGGNNDQVVAELRRLNGQMQLLPATIIRGQRDAALIANA